MTVGAEARSATLVSHVDDWVVLCLEPFDWFDCTFLADDCCAPEYFCQAMLPSGLLVYFDFAFWMQSR